MDDERSQLGSSDLSGLSGVEVETPSRVAKVSTRRRKTSGSRPSSTPKKRTTGKSSGERGTRRRRKAVKDETDRPSTHQSAAKESTPKKKTTRRRTGTDDSPKSTKRRRTSKDSTGNNPNKPKPRSTSGPGKKTARRRTDKTKPRRRAQRRPRASGGLADLISEIISRKGSGESSPVLGSILERLSKGLGLSSGAAQAVVAFVLGKLLVGPGQSAEAGGEAATGGKRTDVDGLLERMRSGKGVDREYVVASGLAQELAEQAHLDTDVAADSLTVAASLFRGAGLLQG